MSFKLVSLKSVDDFINQNNNCPIQFNQKLLVALVFTENVAGEKLPEDGWYLKILYPINLIAAITAKKYY